MNKNDFKIEEEYIDKSIITHLNCQCSSLSQNLYHNLSEDEELNEDDEKLLAECEANCNGTWTGGYTETIYHILDNNNNPLFDVIHTSWRDYGNGYGSFWRFTIRSDVIDVKRDYKNSQARSTLFIDDEEIFTFISQSNVDMTWIKGTIAEMIKEKW